MEPEIHSNLPASSPIIAYGEARGPNLRPKLLALIAGSLVVGLIGVGIWMFARMPIAFPNDSPLVLVVHGGTELPESLPTLWRDAARQSPLPVLVGLSRTENGFEPFVLLPRWRQLPAANNSIKGVTRIVSNVPLPLAENIHAVDLASLFLQLFRHPAYAVVNATGKISDRTMSGSLDGTTWHTETAIATSATQDLPDGDMSVDLTALPDAWSAIDDALARSGFVLEAGDAPSALGWTMTTGSTPTLALRYDNGLASSTLLAIAAATGVYDEHPYTLSDGTVTKELGLPFYAIQATDTPNASGTAPLHLEGTTLYIGNRTETVHVEPICRDGRPIMRFSKTATQNMKSAFPFLISFQLTEIEFVDNQGKLVVCWW